MAKIIVFHTAWMDKYDGDRASLSAGGFRYAREHGIGHEMYNFRNIGGRLYGYVPPTGNLQFEKHFDVPKRAEKLEGVTVVWTAPHPEQGGRAVVGVWREATVYRREQNPTGEVASRRRIGNEVAGYRCTVESKNSVWIHPGGRQLFVRPRQARGFESWPGQQKVFYPQPNSQALARLQEILREIDAGSSISTVAPRTNIKRARRSAWQADVERRKQIEVAAITAVGGFLEDAGFNIKSVEKENLGYDLVASRGEETLHVEVKGRSGQEVAAELSVNELDCLYRYERDRDPEGHYRVAIVTDALSKPVIHEFVLVRGRKAGENSWCTLDGRWRLQFEERKAARLTAILAERARA